MLNDKLAKCPKKKANHPEQFYSWEISVLDDSIAYNEKIIIHNEK